MNSEEHRSFGRLLRHYRIAKHLSQEALAERAQLSPHAISALERGIRSVPRLSTVELLAKALGLTADEQALFTKASRRQQPSPPDPMPPRLPSELTRLVGREVETALLTSWLRVDGIRLLTLTGPSGVGKTRLAQHVARQLLDSFDDGVFFLPFAPLHEPDLVVPLMAQILGLRDAGTQPLMETVRQYLSAKHILLILDNFEQLVEAAPQLADLLKVCPRLTLLVTSRAALRVRGEQEFPVSPLALPDPGALPPVEDLTRYAAVALFVQCAQAVKPDFELTAANAPLVAAICYRLEGLPLSLELAARYTKLFSLQHLLTRLEHRLEVLAHGAQDLPPRQQTLRNAIAWSYELLSADEQRAFRSLAVFVGGATLEALGSMLNVSEGEVLKLVTALVEHSLVQPQEGVQGNVRFGMLETIREYGLEQLAASGQSVHARCCHATYFLEFVQQAERQLRGWDHATWMERVEQEHDNLRAALTWSLATEHELEKAARLTVALASFWLLAGHFDEGRKWLTAVMLRVGAVAPTSTHLRLLLAWAGLLAFYQERGDRRGIAWVLSNLGFIFLAQADLGQAAELFQQSLREAWQAEECSGYGWALVGLGEMAHAQGDLEQASALYTASLALFQESRDLCSCSSLVTRLAQLAQQRGNDEQAGAAFTQGLVLARAIGHQERATLCLEGVTRHNRVSGGVEQVPWPYGTAEMERAQDIVNVLKTAREEGEIPPLHVLLSRAKTGCD